MKIEILLFDGFDDLDAFGPFEVLAGARLDTALRDRRAGRVRHLRAAARGSSRTACVGDPDLVIVPGGGWNDKGGPGCSAEARRGVIPALLEARHAAGRRVGSVCTGAMLLAEAGHPHRPPRDHPPHLARGPQAATASTSSRTRASSTRATSSPPPASPSGIDMALHLVEQALGAEAAEAVRATELEWIASAVPDLDQRREHVRPVDRARTSTSPRPRRTRASRNSAASRRPSRSGSSGPRAARRSRPRPRTRAASARRRAARPGRQWRGEVRGVAQDLAVAQRRRAPARQLLAGERAWSASRTRSAAAAPE